MATPEDERVPYEGGKKFRKRPFLPEINEEPQNVSQEARHYNSSGVSEPSTHQGRNLASIGISELEQILIQKTFTRSEIQRLIELLQSRISEESPSDFIVVERNVAKHPPPPASSPSFVIRLAQQISSPAHAYKCSTICIDQAPRHDSELLNNSATGLSKTLRASPQHPATIENLPEELLSKIFIRLLAKQLAQMRSVSKSWNALLSEPSFVKSHLNRSIHNSDQVFLVFYAEPSSDSDPFTSHPHPSVSSHLELAIFNKLPVDPDPEYCYDPIRVIGSINGLICSYHCKNLAIYVWNPSLCAILTLPPYSMPFDCSSSEIYLRFGYDPKTDDYKVLKFTALIRLPQQAVFWWLDVEIYSMRKGSWKLITERFPSHLRLIYIGSNDRVCADGHDGHLHWLCCIGENSKLKTILAFDLGSETFREIPLPVSTLDYRNAHWHTLGVLAGTLCVLSRFGDGWSGEDVFEVWVMEEYGVAESWVKRHVISEFRDDAWPFGFTSHNELLIDDDGISLYDPVANKTEYFKNYRYGEGGVSKIVEYVDSLVWVAPGQN